MAGEEADGARFGRITKRIYYLKKFSLVFGEI